MEQLELLINLINKRKYHLIIFTVVSTVLIFGLTYLITPKFKSIAIVYPVNLGKYSDENYTEQMLQIIQSREIVDSVINELDLLMHYKISSEKYQENAVRKEFNSNVTIRKTKYESIEIEALDSDADTSKLIVEEIINKYNIKVRTLHRIKLKELMLVNKNQANKWKIIKDSLQYKLQKLNYNYGMVNYHSQLTKLTEGIYRNKASSKTLKLAENQIDDIKMNASEYTYLNNNYNKVLDLYFKYNLALEQQKIEYDKEISYTSVITAPISSAKKYSPKRLVITILGVISLLVLQLGIIIIGSVKNKKIFVE